MKDAIRSTTMQYAVILPSFLIQIIPDPNREYQRDDANDAMIFVIPSLNIYLVGLFRPLFWIDDAMTEFFL